MLDFCVFSTCVLCSCLYNLRLLIIERPDWWCVTHWLHGGRNAYIKLENRGMKIQLINLWFPGYEICMSFIHWTVIVIWLSFSPPEEVWLVYPIDHLFAPSIWVTRLQNTRKCGKRLPYQCDCAILFYVYYLSLVYYSFKPMIGAAHAQFQI